MYIIGTLISTSLCICRSQLSISLPFVHPLGQLVATQNLYYQSYPVSAYLYPYISYPVPLKELAQGGCFLRGISSVYLPLGLNMSVSSDNNDLWETYLSSVNMLEMPGRKKEPRVRTSQLARPSTCA